MELMLVGTEARALSQGGDAMRPLLIGGGRFLLGRPHVCCLSPPYNQADATRHMPEHEGCKESARTDNA